MKMNKKFIDLIIFGIFLTVPGYLLAPNLIFDTSLLKTEATSDANPDITIITPETAGYSLACRY